LVTKVNAAFLPTGWTEVDDLVVLDIVDNAPNNKWETKNITPPGGGRIQVAWRDSFLVYRLRNNIDDVVEAGIYPTWMIVSSKVSFP